MTIIESIYKQPEAWHIGDPYFWHNDGAKVWIKNGLFFCEPLGCSFGLYNKYRLWVAYKWWCINAPVDKLI